MTAKGAALHLSDKSPAAPLAELDEGRKAAAASTCKALICDLDGTLVDTAPDLHRVLQSVMGEIGVSAPPLDAMRMMVGDGARALILRALSTAEVDCSAAAVDRLYERFIELYSAEPCRDSQLFADTRSVLARLRANGWRLGICTNKPQAPTTGLLEALGISGLFDSVVGGDVLGTRKPDPAHLLAVIEELGSSPQHAIMLGDSRNDALVAKAVGTPCILVSFGYTSVPVGELEADIVIEGFVELDAALDRLTAAHPRT
jgi:phosphoglycolate phosphatase